MKMRKITFANGLNIVTTLSNKRRKMLLLTAKWMRVHFEWFALRLILCVCLCICGQWLCFWRFTYYRLFQVVYALPRSLWKKMWLSTPLQWAGRCFTHSLPDKDCDGPQMTFFHCYRANMYMVERICRIDHLPNTRELFSKTILDDFSVLVTLLTHLCYARVLWHT